MGCSGNKLGHQQNNGADSCLAIDLTTPLCTEDIMQELNISRGNVNMNIRSLMEWGIIYKEHKAGERKEYFNSEKDLWYLAQQVIRERRKRELEPVIKFHSYNKFHSLYTQVNRSLFTFAML